MTDETIINGGSAKIFVDGKEIGEAKSYTIGKQINKVHPSGYNRAQRRAMFKEYKTLSRRQRKGGK